MKILLKLKKSVIIITLFLISSLNSIAQEYNYGVMFGVNSSNKRLSKKELGKEIYDSKTTLNLNAFIEYKSKSFWGISIEPGFIQKGSKENFYSFEEGEFDYSQLNYIQVPLLAELFATEKLYFSIGPEFSYLLSAKMKSGDSKIDITDIYDKRFELSGIMGLNYKIFKKFDIGIRYSHGLTRILELGSTHNGQAKEYNKYFQFLIKYRIGKI